MDRLIFGSTEAKLFHCPLPKCQKVILNTARYVNKCRPVKPLAGTNNTVLTQLRAGRKTQPEAASVNTAGKNSLLLIYRFIGLSVYWLV